MFKDYMSEQSSITFMHNIVWYKIYQFTYIDLLRVIISRFQQFSCLFAFVCVLKCTDVLIFNNIDECSSSIDELVPII